MLLGNEMLCSTEMIFNLEYHVLPQVPISDLAMRCCHWRNAGRLNASSVLTPKITQPLNFIPNLWLFRHLPCCRLHRLGNHDGCRLPPGQRMKDLVPPKGINKNVIIGSGEVRIWKIIYLQCWSNLLKGFYCNPWSSWRAKCPQRSRLFYNRLSECTAVKIPVPPTKSRTHQYNNIQVPFTTNHSKTLQHLQTHLQTLNLAFSTGTSLFPT